MTLLRLDPFRWPYSVAQLRLDEPSRSISVVPRAEELAFYGVFAVVPQEQPEFDPAVEKVIEVAPVEVEGEWLQQWEIVALTPEEQEAYYRATNPPRWIEFWDALPDEVDGLLAAARAASPRLELGLGVGLGQAAQGDSRVFLATWQKAKTLGLIPHDLVVGVQALAVAFDLPTEFVGGLE